MTGYVQKPYVIAQLSKAVAEALGGEQRAG
jgi:hypothetical protein